MSVASTMSSFKYSRAKKRKGQQLSETATTYAKYRRVVVSTPSDDEDSYSKLDAVATDGQQWHTQTQYIRKPMPALVINIGKRCREFAAIEIFEDEDELDSVIEQLLNHGISNVEEGEPTVVDNTTTNVPFVNGTSAGGKQQQHEKVFKNPPQKTHKQQTKGNSTKELSKSNALLKKLLSGMNSLKITITRASALRKNSLNASQQAKVSSSNTLRSIPVIDLSIEENNHEEGRSTTIDLTESYATTTDETASTTTSAINPVNTVETNETEVRIVLNNKEVEVEREVYPKLTKEHQAVIKQALHGGSQSEIIIKKFNISITRDNLATLKRGRRLNDEVINFYMNLLIERSEQQTEDGDLPRLYAMSTFFIPKLLSAGHTGLKRWTRKVDIFGYDLIVVPIHRELAEHWCMAIVDLKNQAIRYYDSNGIPNNFLLDVLEQYLRDESLDKRKQPFDTGNFVKENMRDCPRQQNDVDCGVFSYMFAEHEARNRKIRFSQRDIPYFRQKMIYEITEGRLLT